MNPTGPTQQPYGPRWQLAAFVGGILVALIALAFCGRQAAAKNFHAGFTRFHRDIAPDTKYYPTVLEMMAIARERAAGGKILVIVGGNSVLYGVGQPAGRVWTERLQAELGSGYAVVNFAMRGAGVTDGGAVVAEALRQEFPRQIYIANAAPTQPSFPDGTIAYRFVFWDAYYKGLLIDDPARAAAIRMRYRLRPDTVENLDEQRLRAGLDAVLNFGVFWNRFTVEVANTVWTHERPHALDTFGPRKNYADNEPDYLTFPQADKRLADASLAAALQGVRDVSVFTFMPGEHNRWEPYQPAWDRLAESIGGAIPSRLRARTLIVLTRNNPHYLNQLTAAEQQRDDLAYARSVEVWQNAGCEAFEAGRGYTAGDYGDRVHLSSTGGDRLARQVASEVRRMAAKLHY